MPTNRWRGDAASGSKKLTLIGPNNVLVQVVVSVGNKFLTFGPWSASRITSELLASGFPELAGISIAVSGNDVILTGPEDTDFDVQVAISPTVETEFTQGSTPQNQQTRLAFNAATGGDYTLTCNGTTTAAIDLLISGGLNPGGVVTAIEALADFTAGDVVAEVLDGEIILTWQGNFAELPVSVVMDSSGLDNGGVISISERQQARPATHDIWFMGTEDDIEFVLTDGVGSVEMLTNESDAVMSAKITAAFGYQVDVYSEELAPTSGVINRKFYVIDLVGAPGTSPALVATSSMPGGGIGFIAIEKKVDRTDTKPSEVFLVDRRAGSIIVEYHGEELTIDSGLEVLDNLHTVNQFTAWTMQTGISSAEFNAPIVGSNLYLLFYDSELSVTEPQTGGIDLTPDIFRQTGGEGSLVTLQNGGDTNAAIASVHAYYLHAANAANVAGLSGIYSLEFPEGTTVDLTPASNAAAVQTAVNNATGVTVAVAGTGKASDPFLIEYTGDPSTRALPAVAQKKLTGDGSGSALLQRQRVVGVSGSAIIRVSQTADGGFYFIQYGNSGPVQFEYNESAATFLAALQEFPALATAGDVAVNFNPDSGEYEIQFQNGLAKQRLEYLTTRGNSLTDSNSANDTRRVATRPTGPGNFAEPLNWSLGRVPDAGDEILFDESLEAIRYGLRQFVVVTADTATDTLTAAGGMDFVTGQQIEFKFGDVAIGGLTAGTKYFVTAINVADGTFQVSATEYGQPVSLTAAGTGPHYGGLMAADVQVYANFTQSIGLPRRNDDGYDEYAQRFLQIGIDSAGAIIIGDGDGSGSSLLRIDAGNSAGQITVMATSLSQVQGVPSLLIDADSDDLSILIQDGEAGVAVYDDEVAKLGQFNVLGGSLAIGSVTVVGNAIATAGSLTAKRMAVGGLLNIRG